MFISLKALKKLIDQYFAHPDFILQLKGREIDENALILVEKDEVIGYGYTNLSFQESQIAILKSLLTPIEHKELARTIVKNYLKNNTGLKIKRF